MKSDWNPFSFCQIKVSCQSNCLTAKSDFLNIRQLCHSRQLFRSRNFKVAFIFMPLIPAGINGSIPGVHCKHDSCHLFFLHRLIPLLYTCLHDLRHRLCHFLIRHRFASKPGQAHPICLHSKIQVRKPDKFSG